ncbi:alpha/beta hydrolase [Halobacillus litoralis]|uniref:alpha/beta hydrolase n=1 Tax=Halobacillus litoralis TaxID=45668 RepID=UPI001CD2CC76|nr:alpha/beta hydrolase [Halobacillus litoralis]MCA0972340.1 alpha/beta hydrolase [Halobacillus litoralis]
MKRFIKYAAISVVVLLLVAVIGFYIWTQQTYQPSEQLNQWVSDIEKSEGWVVFEPDEEPESGVILYPGAKVEPEAYGYLAEQLAEAGYLTGVPDVRLNLALTDSSKAEELIERYPHVDNWYVGGHSLGGVAAASFASKDEAAGVIFLASYPTEGTSFADTDVPILSIYGEKDGLTTPEKIEETEPYLSDQTTLHQIDGGNHAQFGVYGEQKGDRAADISVKEQQDEIVEVITQWLKEKNS